MLASLQADIAQWILDSRPAAVILETAVTPQHGLATGNVFDCITGPQDPVQPFFRQVALSPGAAGGRQQWSNPQGKPAFQQQ